MCKLRTLQALLTMVVLVGSIPVVSRAAAVPLAPPLAPSPQLSTVEVLPEGVTQERAIIEIACSEKRETAECTLLDRLLVRNTTGDQVTLVLDKPRFESGTVQVGNAQMPVVLLPTNERWDKPEIETRPEWKLEFVVSPGETLEIRTVATFHASVALERNNELVFFAPRTQHLFLDPEPSRFSFSLTTAQQDEVRSERQVLTAILRVPTRWTQAEYSDIEHVSSGVFRHRSSSGTRLDVALHTAPISPARVTGPMIMLGATVTLPNDPARFTLGVGTDITFHPWVVGNIMLETDFQQAFRIAPTVSVQTPYVLSFFTMLLPSFSAGIGTPLRIVPQLEPGLRVTATAQYPILGAYFAADYYPLSNTGELTGGVRAGF